MAAIGVDRPQGVDAMSDAVFALGNEFQTLMSGTVGSNVIGGHVLDDNVIHLFQCFVSANLILEQQTCCPYLIRYLGNGNRTLFEFTAYAKIPRGPYETTARQGIDRGDSALHNINERQLYCLDLL